MKMIHITTMTDGIGLMAMMMVFMNAIIFCRMVIYVKIKAKQLQMDLMSILQECGHIMELFKDLSLIHICLLHAALPAAIPLDDGSLEGHALEPGHMERDVAGGGGEIPIIVTAAVALTSQMCIRDSMWMINSDNIGDYNLESWD